MFFAIDKFSKWIEVKPMVKYSAAKAAEFIEEIMHSFVILKESSLTLAVLSWAMSFGILVKILELKITTPL